MRYCGLHCFIETCGGKKVGNPVSATFGIDGDLVDIELLIPIDKLIQSNGRYIYKEQLKLTNALMAGEELWEDPQRSLA